jgi:thymidylate synthase (FAD)
VKIITAPTVTLVSSPGYTPHPMYPLPAHDVEAENIIAMGGKVCYDSYGLDGNPVDRHIHTLVDSGHHSVLEHVHVGVFIEGISRGCSHEIVRHRMFNYSQRSTRYTAEDDAAIVLDPYFAAIYTGSRMGEHDHIPDLRTDAGDVDADCSTGSISLREYALVAAFLDDCRYAVEKYAQCAAELVQLNPEGLTGRDLRKWSRGKARQLLPHALETRMVMTGNLRAWRHFLVMRSSRHAEAEIRRLAEAVHAIVAPIAPTAFADLNPTLVGSFIEWAD